MGLFKNDLVDLIKFFKKNGTVGKSLVMIGKQDILISKEAFKKIVTSLNIVEEDNKYYQKIIRGRNEIDSYDLFYMIGFNEVHAIDVSDFEGADIIVDLNDELPEKYFKKFDYVLNGGTLEHVFDIAKGMDNITRLVKEGGRICHIVPAAGWINHGFYSISPTFFVDYCSKNGYSIDELRLEFLVRKDRDIDNIFSFYSEDIRLEDNNISLNGYVNLLQNIEGIDEVLLICYASNSGNINDYGYPIQGYYEKIYTKLESKDCCRNKQFDFIKMAKDIINLCGRTAIYGCGNMFDLLLDELIKNGGEHCFDVVFDKDVRKCGTEHRGVKVEYPLKSKLLDGWDNIVICSSNYEADIRKYLLIEGYEYNIITLSDYSIANSN